MSSKSDELYFIFEVMKFTNKLTKTNQNNKCINTLKTISRQKYPCRIAAKFLQEEKKMFNSCLSNLMRPGEF